jgi:two-component system, LytTR family, response regulator
MKKISCIVIDDEPLAIDVIKLYLLKFDNIEVIAECLNGVEAVNAILEKRPDLLFLDVQMPDLNGFEVLKEIDVQKKPVVVFTTAYDNYAIQAFDVNAADYLLKPFAEDRFDVAVARALTVIQSADYQNINRALEALVRTYDQLKEQEYRRPWATQRLLVKENRKIFFVKTSEIRWIEAAGDYVQIYTENKFHLINDSLSSLENKLDPKTFIRIHRSSIVNVDYIKEFQPYFNGEYKIILKNGEVLKLSRTYKDKIKELFGEAIQ